MEKVLVLGKNGQLAREVVKTKPDNIELIALGSNDLDIRNKKAIGEVFKAYKPDIVINTAAYTAVDKAESEMTAAYAINEQGVAFISEASAKHHSRLFHISTDFVFDGRKSTPYTYSDKTNPLGVYGASKLAGEKAVCLYNAKNSIIIRTAWVYSAHGNNFVKTMLRLMQEKPKLGVVYDQVGSPTWAKGLATTIWQLIDINPEIPEHSPLQLNWTDSGIASWYDFAVAIQELAISKGILSKAVPINAIPSSSFPTPAKRPSFSVLDKTDLLSILGIESGIHWRTQLSSMLDELKD
ncbi:dTDP-4-dehydrorhamnose reductase [Pokkaliibacter plantistimulans]|uniref:dTDP-4-dehydrorhamnose reductase n=1 Tax=Pokkaliibacter plantistimulans TaxID=1635171 RepID=A0ABX5M310_9GAMM|nr:dTDP-4-dehydrorhamnose reductase [Pokkaliibacter plantistimulans]PXF31971.1 dTDP-4-dehydrorhamnose reductase [Pokkaliibacter plantistimulans]